MNRRLFLSGLLGVFLPGCGSSSGPAENFPTLVPIPGKKLLFGYYSCDDTQISETLDHTNLLWISGFGSSDPFTNVVNQLQQAKRVGVKRIVLSVEDIYKPGGETSVRLLLSSLQNTGLLGNIYALYPFDEPDNHGKSAEEVIAKNTLVRQICQDYSELKECPLFGVYGGNRNYPGIESYDIVAFDDYDNRGAIFNVDGEFAQFKAKTRPDQQIFIFPAGADDWKQDPAAFYKVALSDPQVAGIVAFLWINAGAKLGIKNNGMAPTYRALGKQIKDANP